jgi:aryl-alcohol dehydrogenase-like predicted oxidoreductase
MVRIINNPLEQDPARELIILAEEHNCALVFHVPHASDLLDGTYDPDNTSTKLTSATTVR